MSEYEKLGVSATKTEVHAATRRTDPGLFPGAFCRVGEDVLGGDADWCSVLHADGAGTKALVAYLMFRETGDPKVFRGLAQDAVVMNLDDLACVGAVDRFVLANTIARNSFFVPGAALQAIIEGYEECLRILRSLGITIIATGGETADLVDNVRTLVVDANLATRLPRAAVVDDSRIEPGDVIVGLSSTGRAAFESVENSGIGSNGLTLARHALLAHDYAERYPESFSPEVPKQNVYRGPYHLGDRPAGLSMTIGEALTSPTRPYAPIIRDLLREAPGMVHGIIHNTGGGQAKCGHFGRGIAYVKDDLFPCPPIYRLIAETGVPWPEMYQTFNMGHRMEVFVPVDAVDAVVSVSARYGIEAKAVGRCEKASDSAPKVRIESEHGAFDY